MGYKVKVVHFCNALPIIYSFIGKLFKRYGMKKMWSVNFLRPNRKKAFYEIEGIPVIYIPVIHSIPHVELSNRRRSRAFKYLLSTLIADCYVPDYIVSHWYGMAYYMPFFKKTFPNAKTSVVLHNNVVYNKNFFSLFNSVDTWGFRSKSIKESFEHEYGIQQREFICYSGVPSEFVPATIPALDFSKGINRFVYLGSLLKLKNVDITIKALHNCFNGKDFVFDIIGNGSEMDTLQNLVKELGEERNVIFHGRLSRNKALEIVGGSQIFIMVSCPEAFGLVYVEAMAKGCIPIATIGQGADGFIIDGKNGYLCKANDIEELCTVIEKIRHQDSHQLASLSLRAYETAANMTDEKVAEDYLKNVLF